MTSPPPSPLKAMEKGGGYFEAADAATSLARHRDIAFCHVFGLFHVYSNLPNCQVQVSTEDGRLRIDQEGREPKFRKSVQEKTFAGEVSQCSLVKAK
jgi:hypothetical protein